MPMQSEIFEAILIQWARVRTSHLVKLSLRDIYYRLMQNSIIKINFSTTFCTEMYSNSILKLRKRKHMAQLELARKRKSDAFRNWSFQNLWQSCKVNSLDPKIPWTAVGSVSRSLNTASRTIKFSFRRLTGPIEKEHHIDWYNSLRTLQSQNKDKIVSESSFSRFKYAKICGNSFS